MGKFLVVPEDPFLFFLILSFLSLLFSPSLPLFLSNNSQSSNSTKLPPLTTMQGVGFKPTPEEQKVGWPRLPSRWSSSLCGHVTLLCQLRGNMSGKNRTSVFFFSLLSWCSGDQLHYSILKTKEKGGEEEEKRKRRIKRGKKKKKKKEQKEKKRKVKRWQWQQERGALWHHCHEFQVHLTLPQTCQV